MSHRFPSSCFGAVSSIRHARAGVITLNRCAFQLRPYATEPVKQAAADLNRPEKSALLALQCRDQADRVNPARSTLPAPLTFPKDKSDNVFVHWFRIGRAYGSFYWIGVKAVWFNYQAVRALKEMVQKEDGRKENLPGLGSVGSVSRAEYQLVHRNNYDIGKLPFFGVLVLIFGEWLPLLVPFMPGVVPGTCRIPKQVIQMRQKAEERRQNSFRQGISEPAQEQLLDQSPHVKARTWPLTDAKVASALLSRLRGEQLLHLSSVLNLHNSLWDRIQQQPPTFLLRRNISKRLAYITGDDLLLERCKGVQKLSVEELEIACSERGLDVTGKHEDRLRSELAWWLARQSEDRGQGKALLTMLFRRPNAWDTKAVRRSS